MNKKKLILTTMLFTVLSFSGVIFINVCAEEKKPEASTHENKINAEKVQNTQDLKKNQKSSVPKKDSTLKKEDPPKKNPNKQQEKENENKEKPTPQKEEEKALDLPNVSNSEIELRPYFSGISQNIEDKNILKTIISWILILSGVFLILKVVFSNKKIPKNYSFSKKNKHTLTPHKRRTSKYKF